MTRGRVLWTCSTVVALVAIVLSVEHIVPIVRATAKIEHAARAQAAAGRSSTAIATSADRDYGPTVIGSQLRDVEAAIPVHASVRMIAVTPDDAVDVTVIEHGKARTYTDDIPNGFPRAATRALTHAAPISLDDVDLSAPSRMVTTMVAGHDRSIDRWTSLALTAGRHGRPSHWTAVWDGAFPARFSADEHGEHVRIVSGSWR